MFKNYLLTAWKVLLRRKLFTFINLFAITLTLTVLIVTVALIESVISPSGAEKNSNDYVVINRVTLLMGNKNSSRTRKRSSEPGYKFLVDHVLPIPSAEKISLYSTANRGTVFDESSRLNVLIRHTDVNYFDILDFEFIEGRNYTPEEADNGQFVAVINERLRDSYFKKQNVRGEEIVINQQRYTVIGVVKNTSELETEAYTDVWVPIKTLPSTSYITVFLGGWQAMLFSNKTNGIRDIQNDYHRIIRNEFKSPDPKLYRSAISFADTKLESLARKYNNTYDKFESGVENFVFIFLVLVLLFMLLPSINMININVSRIYERATEIGLRKSFGASTPNLVAQFLLENILLTAIGGLLGFISAYLILIFLIESTVFPNAEFGINFNVAAWGIFLVFVFGFLSGIYPAWKMSRLHPVSALKGGN